MRHRSAVLTTLLIGVATGAQAQSRSEAIDIAITARTPNAVQVEESFSIGSSAPPVALRVLTRPCMVVENLRVERNGVELTGSEARHGPWIVWRDSSASRADSGRLSVRYDVWLGGSRTIPLAHFDAPPARGDSSRNGAITVAIRFARGAGEIEFPHMTRQAPGVWSGRYIAVPSFVKIGGFAFPCDRLPPPGDNGGLVWRFSLLVGIMVAWVPLYLSWARRTGENA